MPREKDPLVVDCFSEGKDDKGKAISTCKFCGKCYAPNATRQRGHILKECKQVPLNVQMRYSFPIPGTFTPSSSSSTEANVADENNVDNPSGGTRGKHVPGGSRRGGGVWCLASAAFRLISETDGRASGEDGGRGGAYCYYSRLERCRLPSAGRGGA